MSSLETRLIGFAAIESGTLSFAQDLPMRADGMLRQEESAAGRLFFGRLSLNVQESNPRRKN